jgi:hypothetical protein
MRLDQPDASPLSRCRDCRSNPGWSPAANDNVSRFHDWNSPSRFCQKLLSTIIRNSFLANDLRYAQTD